MRVTLTTAGTIVATLTLLAALAAPGSAHPRVELDPTLPFDATYAATDNIEYLGRFPEHAGNAGGRVIRELDRFYLTDPRGVYVYDTSRPENPTLLASLQLLQDTTGVALAQEDPDTDGNILLVDAIDPQNPTPFSQLQVVDVSDPENGLSVLGTVDVTDHTWNCVSAEVGGELNRCAYAYGRTGHIVDLTDPTAPELLDRTWRAAVGYGDRGNSPYAHDLTEIRPGLVMSAGAQNILMDTTDPTAPIELTRVAFLPPRFTKFGYHSVEWANGGADPIAVFGTELAPSLAGRTDAAGTDCDSESTGGENAVVETWDASLVAAALEDYEAGQLTAEEFRAIEFTRLDQFDAGSRGIFLDGEAPSHLLYCAHWMELHPDFDGAGLMAVSYYDRGTRFVDVAPDGTMTEIGWIVPAEGYSGSPQWITDEVVYIMDYRRGLEIVKLTGDEATGVYENTVDVIAASSVITPAALHGSDRAATAATTIGFGLLLAALAWRHRRQRATAGI